MGPLLFLALLLGFWLPPLLIGRWLRGRYSLSRVSLVAAPIWSLLWLLVMLSMIGAQVPNHPSDGPGMMAAGAIDCALYVVLPASAIARWLGMRRYTPLGDKLRLGISVAMFALAQVLLIGPFLLN